MKYFFYSLNPIKISDLSSDELQISVTNSFDSEITVSFNESTIKILPNDGASFISTLDNMECFEIVTPNDLSILRYFFIKYGILFYDEEYHSIVEYLDKNEDELLFDNTLREYIFNCMLHYGIIKNIEELNEKVMGDERKMFFNEYYVQVGLLVRLKRMRRQLFFMKVKYFFRTIFNKIKNIFN